MLHFLSFLRYCQLVWLLFAIVSLVLPSTAARNCSITTNEYASLEAFYNSTGGPSWQLRPFDAKWVFPSDLSRPCSDPVWAGLTCELLASSNTTCGVTSMYFGIEELTGHLPTQLGMLTNLLSLTIHYAYFGGTALPTEIGLLTNLEKIDISYAGLGGTIPTTIGNIPKLNYLAIYANYLVGSIPTEIGLLSDLNVLDLYINSLSSSIPDTLYELSQLTQLIVSANELTGTISSKIGQLHRVVELDLTTNYLTGTLPTEIGQMSALGGLTLSYLSLSGSLPTELYSCRLLALLDLQQTLLTGSISPLIANLKILTTYALPNNFVTGSIPTETGSLRHLETLALGSNLLSGNCFPVELTNISVMFEFTVQSNICEGSIPSEIRHMHILAVLELSDNSFTSFIPSELGTLLNMSQLSLDHNSLTGTIPSEIGYLSAAELIYLDANYLTGTIPSGLFNELQIELVEFGLDNMFLTGSLPETVVLSPNLAELFVYQNLLSSSIPANIGTMTILFSFWINDNYFTSSLPADMNRLQKLDTFNLYQNFLSGKLHEKLFVSLEELQVFVGCNNLFSGSIPSVDMTSHSNLELFDIHDNRLNGTFPTEFELVDTLRYINVANNSLTGSLPFELISSPMLQGVILGGNRFNGTINGIVFGSNLTTIDLSANLLTGTFPSELPQLLQSLILQNNSLTGEISITHCIPSTTTPHQQQQGNAQLLAYQLTNLLIGYNSFTGNLSALACYTNLTILSIEHNNFDGNLNALATLTNLHQLIAYSNQLTGTLPTFLATFSQLHVLLLSSNRFIGNPNNIFNSELQTLLTSVDISSNDFTGLIPSNVFLLPNLQSFASMKTCFSGSLPDTICEAINLEILLLDGITSGLSCQHKFHIIHTSDAYISTNGPLKGGILDCIWSLTALRSLHLSGNGLTGTIGIPIANSNLTSIVLSYNELSGTIPIELQQLPFTTLELSNNRLKGVITAELAIPSAVVDLENNRLSGFLPISYSSNSLIATNNNNNTNSSDVFSSQINVMRGNLFNCDAKHPKPIDTADIDANSTSCGSQQLNDSLVVWTICVVFVAIGLLMCICFATIAITFDWKPNNNLKNMLLFVSSVAKFYISSIITYFYCGILFNGKIVIYFFRCFDCFVSKESSTKQSLSIAIISILKELQSILIPISIPKHLIKVRQFLYTINSLVLYLLSFVGMFSILLCIPLYLCMKWSFAGQYSTHTYQYQWALSTAFSTGLLPAVIVICLYCCIAVYTYIYVCCVSNLAIQQQQQPQQQQQQQPQQQQYDDNKNSIDTIQTTMKRIESDTNSYDNNSCDNSCSSGATVRWNSVNSNHSNRLNNNNNANNHNNITSKTFAASQSAMTSTSIASEFDAEQLPIQSTKETQLEITNINDKSVTFWNNITSIIILLLHIMIMSVVNVLYLFVLLSGSYTTGVITVVQMSISVFKVIWDGFLIPFVLNRTVIATSSHTYAMIKFACSITSSVVVPFVVSLFANSLCFLDLLIPQSVVNENFYIELAARQPCETILLPTPNITLSGDVPPAAVNPPTVPTTVTECVTYSSAGVLSTDFYPPFAYSYQCGSGILTSYIPVLLYSIAFRVVVLFVRKIYYFSTHSNQSQQQQTSKTNVISINVTQSQSLICQGTIFSSLMLDIVLMSTFGLASPLVAIVLVCSIVIEVSWYLYRIYHIDITCDLAWLEEEASSYWKVSTQCLWYCLYVSSAFWALMIFDMIGDQNVHKPANALWGPLLILSIPILIKIVDYFDICSIRGNRSNQQQQLRQQQQQQQFGIDNQHIPTDTHLNEEVLVDENHRDKTLSIESISNSNNSNAQLYSSRTSSVASSTHFRMISQQSSSTAIGNPIIRHSSAIIRDTEEDNSDFL